MQLHFQVWFLEFIFSFFFIAVVITYITAFPVLVLKNFIFKFHYNLMLNFVSLRLKHLGLRPWSFHLYNTEFVYDKGYFILNTTTFKFLVLENTFIFYLFHYDLRGRHGCDRMVVGFTTTYAISAYHH